MKDILEIKEWNDPKEIYSFALKAHSAKAMKDRKTWIYNLRSVVVIKDVIKNKGRFFALLKDGKPVSVISVVKGFYVRPLDDPNKLVEKKAWEVGAMLTDKKERGKGHSRRLFRHALSILRKMNVNYFYVIATGTYNLKNKGVAREMSIPVVKICEKCKGELIGYGFISYGPIYKMKL